MEETKQQPEDQSKEAKKVEERYQNSLKTLTAVFGGPDWAKTVKIKAERLPSILAKIIEKKQEEQITKFEEAYVKLVERKRQLDKTEAEKRKEFERIITEEKKAFNKEVDAVRALFEGISQIEKEYYETLGTENAGESPEPTEDTQHQ